MPFQPFFPPSSEITRKVMNRIGQRRANTIRESITEPPSRESEGSHELLGSILAALETDAEYDGTEADWEDQRWLSGVLYHFMGLRAGRIRRGAESDEITRYDIVEGMRHGLGLLYEEDLPLLEQVAEEFSSWLREENDVYVAGWGTIVRDQYNSFHLKPLAKPDTETEEPLIKMFDRRAAAQGGVSANLDLIER